MSEKADRSAGGSRPLLWTAAALVCVAAAAGAYLWQRVRVPASPQLSAQPPVTQAARSVEPVLLTFYYPMNGELVLGQVPVKRQPDAQSQAREALSAVLADQRIQQSALLREVKLRACYLDASGAAYIDLAPLSQNGVKASAWEELLALYGIADTLIQNFEEVKLVRFLIDGKEAQTLAGHIDLSRKFEKRMDLVKQ
jgi:germination protein M